MYDSGHSAPGQEVSRIREPSSFSSGVHGLTKTVRKRPSYNVNTPSKPLIQIWSPLFDFLSTLGPDFPSELARHIVNLLTTDISEPTSAASATADDRIEEKKERQSFKWTLCTWLSWLWAQDGTAAISSDIKVELRQAIALALLDGDTA